MTIPLRNMFESLVRNPPGKRKYIFITDNRFYAETLQSTESDAEYMTVYVTEQPTDNAYTTNEFHDYICDFGAAIYASDFFYFPICSKARNAEIYNALKDRGCKYSSRAWREFTLGADYFQQHETELLGAAQRLIDRAEGRTKKATVGAAAGYNSEHPYNTANASKEQDGRDWADNPPQAVNAQGFKEIIPFEQSEALPPFPLNALPPATRQYIYAAAETVQAPVDMVGSCVLGTLEIACRGRYPTKLPNGHTERPCFYIVPIAPPSERKSGVIDIVLRPLIDYEIKYNDTHGGEVNQSKSELKLLQGRIDNAEKNAIKEKDTGKRHLLMLELEELNTELAGFKTVEPLRLSGADVTPEKLAAMLKSQRGVFALVSAEGGGLFENIGRYSDKGGLEIYLNGYSGDTIWIDRKNSESISIDRPTLNKIAPCQPSVIVDLFSDKQKSGRGLLSRILFVKCLSRVGSRKVTSKPLDERIKASYRNLCFAMLDAESNGNLEYDSGGFEVYRSFFDEIEPQLTPDIGELSYMAEWAGKLHGQMTRLAGLIHCINAFEQGKNPLDTQINADEARAAVVLAKYFLAHAKAVYMEQAEPPEISNARYLWNKIISINSPQISKSILTRKTQGKQEFSLDECLTALVERGYIRVEHSNTGTAGRPSETIFINPEVQAIVNKLNLLKQSPESGNNFNFFNNFTMPAKIETEIIPDEDNPFLEV